MEKNITTKKEFDFVKREVVDLYFNKNYVGYLFVSSISIEHNKYKNLNRSFISCFLGFNKVYGYEMASGVFYDEENHKLFIES